LNPPRNMKIRQRLRSALWRVPVDQEVHDELAHHIELRTQELVERGIDRETARAEAVKRFGDVRRLESQLASLGHRRDRVFARRQWLDELRQDVTFALRQCRRWPGFTAAAVLTLALGIGATTAIFSVVHAVVLRPYPFSEPERVLFVYTLWRGSPGNVSAGNYDYIRQRLTTVDHLAAVMRRSFNLAAEGTVPERIGGLGVTSNYFAVFGVPPLHGRVITPDEDRPGGNNVVVLSHALWQRRFGGDRNLVGRQIQMNGVSHEVIGIMPASFDEPTSSERLWVPIGFTPERLAMYDEHYLELYGRRRADATLQQVNEELARVAKNLAQDHPEFNQDRGAAARVLSEAVIGDYRTRLFVLLAAVGLVLLIACANVANLLLARLASRSRELAIRAAIGAGRGRIVRQVLTESLVLATIGGAAGLLFARWALPALIASAPEGVPRLATATLNSAAVGAALGMVIASAALVGLLPAWQISRGRTLRDDLSDGKGSSGGSIRPWVRQTLVASQAALVLIVLTGAALLVRSAIKLQAVPIGFETAGILSARVTLPTPQYSDPTQAKNAFRTILDSIAGAPGVAAAALDSQPPLVPGGGGSNGLFAEGRAMDMSGIIQSRAHFVSPDYFRVLQIPLRAGRTFTEQDVRSAPLVMIINETLAREAFPGQDAIGKRISCCEGGPGKPSWKIVVGVVANVRTRGPADPPTPEFYLPIMQIPDVAWMWIGRTLNIIARSAAGDPAMLTSAIRQAVGQFDPALPVYAIRTMDEGLRASLAQARFNSMLMTLLGTTGLVLAALGIYSVIAWLVAQRSREIGVRMALGASAGDVVRQVTLHGLTPVTIGIAVGVVGALAAGRLLQGQLFEVGARDPLAIGSVVSLMLMVAVLAGVIPAARAARIDPSRALHEG
jgi:putative ABC transport system permease protein